ncbi:MAGE family-domain-containing protein [Aspergillus tamarii]|uniref:MAGE family-domain-containing protein n=1 Tax=Aspergillus tamarii TaxID=41984 RepID=A0A5N6UVM1_ASPTM|nr:MAGE family-domain-containing protein [Aspergillus tamarii]
MPHAEPKKMGENAVNGEKVHSHFLDHLTSYPVVSDSITVFKSNKYGAKSIQYADQSYDRIAKPFLPYFSKPYGYIAPYLARADSLGDQGLSQIDSRFPFIKEDTDKLRNTIYDNATYPVRFVGDVKAHVFDTYGSEYKKCGGDGVVASGKALITTSLVLSQESLGFLSSLLQAKKEQVKDVDPPPSHPSNSSEPESSGSEEEQDQGPNPQRRRTTNQTQTQASASDSDDDATHHPSSTDVMVKKMVRLALACEYARLPIRRTEIGVKVLGEQGARQFKVVFEAAQKVLREKFGMQMVELPARERVTIHDRRAAQKVEKPSSSNKSWIVESTLPAAYRRPEILPPTKAPWESTYTGLYSFIIAVILLNGGSLPEQKLERYLARTNADTYTPIDRTDRLLQRLVRDGYLVRLREMDGGEEVIEYMVGQRGKMEVGTVGVAGLVREVYGSGNMTAEQREDFEARLARSLGIKQPEPREEGEGEGEGEEQNGDVEGDGTQRRQSQRRRRAEEEEEEEEEEDDDDDDDDEDEDSD